MRCYRQGQDIKAIMLESMYPAWIMTSHGYIDGFHKSSPSLPLYCSSFLRSHAIRKELLQVIRRMARYLGEGEHPPVKENQ